MATTVINTTFKLKRGTAARWAELNPILAQGEPGFAYDTYELKVGDGATPWKQLPYADSKARDAVNNLATLVSGNTESIEVLAQSVQANTKAIAEVSKETQNILAIAKQYTDDQIGGIPAATAKALGLVKIDDDTIKMNGDNQLYVAKVSTDVLEMGEQTIVLDGGTSQTNN